LYETEVELSVRVDFARICSYILRPTVQCLVGSQQPDASLSLSAAR